MTLLSALILGQAAAPATAADFFPLANGLRRVYEVKTNETTTVYDQVGDSAVFGDKPAVAIVRTNPLTNSKDTTYYSVDGATVLIVGYGEDRSHATMAMDDPSEGAIRKQTNVLMSLVPAMPVFKYEGGETKWSFAARPRLDGKDTDAVKIDGVTKPGGERTVLGKKVETIEVRAEVTIGTGRFPQKIVETTVYGKGIGMVESTRKATIGKQTSEVRTKLIGLEGKTEGR